jgi:YYY domain-containing protein
MIELFQMWAMVEALGIVCLPLTITVFHNLPDRGWAFTKAIGMATLAFAVWFPLVVFHSLPFSRLFIAGVLLLVVLLNLVGFLRVRRALFKFVRTNIPYIVLTEAVFLGMVFLLGWIRSYGPDIRSFEMFMDEGFIAAIMRSPHLPPNDMWFAGYPINYYYYAHFIIAMLAKLLGQIPSVAFNTGICIYFGLTAAAMFGITCNIVTWARYARARSKEGVMERSDRVLLPVWKAVPYGIMSSVMGLILGNLAATQQWWMDHGELTQYNWFSPSRVIDKTINEFPAFSFLLSCFHAHVLTLAFTIVGIALAFNLFLEADGKGLNVFGRGWRLPLTLWMTALILGGLFVMNGWDYPTYMGLALVCIALQQWKAYHARITFNLILDVFTAGALLVALSFLLYVPFYLNFISPSQGIGIVDAANRSPLGGELLIYGIFAFVYLSLLVASTLKRPLVARFPVEPSPVSAPENETVQRLKLYAGLAGIALFLVAGIATLLFLGNSTTFVVTGSIAVLGAVLVFYTLDDRSQSFALLLGATAFALVAMCEVVFLRDVFASSYPRMNTVFKFYFQAWSLLAITSGTGLYFILDSFRLAPGIAAMQRVGQRVLQGVWGLALLAFLVAGTAYPIAGTYARTDFFAQRTNSLDGLNYLQYDPNEPGDYAAIRWINANIKGDPVIVEAVGPDYSSYARISAFTGLPTIIGWVGHEYQWRVNWLIQPEHALNFNRRSFDVDTIYTNPNSAVVLSTMARYHAQYLYVGPLEHQKYQTVNLSRFRAFMQTVYNADGVTIYKVK